MAFCVFCGATNLKSARTKEHILPMWLLKATGDPNRRIRLGFDPNSGREWIRPASTFHFPACDPCNKAYGKGLEAQAQKIVSAISKGQSISVAQAYRLLDWLDKVRIGLWLGYFMLNKETTFQPKFHIGTRLGTKDRLAVISMNPKDNFVGLSFGGHDNDLFRKSQSGLYLRINNIRILSISSDYVVSRNAGLPTPGELLLRQDDSDYFACNLKIGTYQVSQDWSPVSGLGGTILAQPIIDTRFSDTRTAANVFFNSRVVSHAKDRVRVHRADHYRRVLPLQLISNSDGTYRYYSNKRQRIRLCSSPIHNDAAFLHYLYVIMLERILPLFPREIQMSDGNTRPSLDAYRSYFEIGYQIISRIQKMGLPTADATELIEDIQRINRIIEERDAFLRGSSTSQD